MAQNGHQPNRVAVVTGFGIGVVWIIASVFILVYAARGFADNRPDYGMSWSLVGVFLLAAGFAALGGTWWHQLRTPQNDH